MKNIIRYLLFSALTSFVAIAVVGLSSSVGSASDSGLTLVHTDLERQWYVNTGTLVSPARGTVSFWNKIVPVKGGTSYSQLARMLEKAGKNPARLEYVQTLQELDCGTNRSKIWSVIFYDGRDRIVFSSTAAQTLQTGLASEPAANTVRNAVCADSRGEAHD